MKSNVLITGAKGFIGKNLVVWLKNLNRFTIYEYDVDDSPILLDELIKKADIIFHLAGVNRPEDIHEFQVGNTELTRLIVTKIIDHQKIMPIVFSSSVQAELDNPYGISKKQAENVLFDYTKKGGELFIFRFPNVFGKWSKPNYNSVIATFCHNISRELDITISSREKHIELVYIDDVIKEFIKILEKKIKYGNTYYSVPVIYKVNLGFIVDTLYQFLESRKTLVLPDMSDTFIRKLYATYLSYLPEDAFSYDLQMHTDKRGFLFELIKSNYFGQIFVSTTKPRITRGNHYHHSKFEKFCVIKGNAVICFRHLLDNKIITYEVSGEKPQVVEIPCGYTHSITNSGNTELITLYWASEIFDADNPDTYFEEVKR